MKTAMGRFGRIAALCAVLGVVAAAGWVGLLGGQARETRKDLLSRFASADVERSVRAACGSPAPFVVLDTFTFMRPANLDDVSGEATAPAATIGHGDVVAAIAAASHGGAIPYQVNPVFNVETLTADIGRLARDIESGRIARPAAVVSSIVLPIELSEANARTRGKPFTPDDVASRRAELAEVVTDGHDPKNAFTQIENQLRRLRRAGVPIFVAAGNAGPDTRVNALALFDGVYAVGSLGKDGARAPYTSLPEFVSVWTRGYFVLRETPDGLVLGEHARISGASLPEQKAVLADFVGRRAEDLVRNIPKVIKSLPSDMPIRLRNRLLAMQLEPGVYRTADLMEAYGRAKGTGSYESAVSEGSYMHYPSDTIFTTDAGGALRFDPLGDDSIGQLQVQDATSFAAPNICSAAVVDPTP
jgi:hypothetical protein